MKHSSYYKDILRQIWRTRSRFLSIFAIIALGTGFFAGLKATTPDMKQTAQAYFSEQNLMDVHLKSTMGFSENDIAAIEGYNHIRDINTGYSVDAFVTVADGSNVIVRAYSINSDTVNDSDTINRPVLTQGRYPQADNECVVDADTLMGSNYKLGDTITLFLTDSDIGDTLSQKTFTIVGFVNSPLYISFERGSSSIGNGVIRSYIMIPESVFRYDVYTDVYLTLDGTDKLSFYDSLYQNLVDSDIDDLQVIADARQTARYNEIYSEQSAKLNDAQNELNDGIDDYYAGAKEFYGQIDAAQQRIDDGQAQIDANHASYEQGIAALNDGWAQYNSGYADAMSNKALLDAQQKQIDDSRADLSNLDTLRTNIAALLTTFETAYVPIGSDLPADVSALISASSAFDEVLGSGTDFATVLETYIRTVPATPEKSALEAQLNGYLGGVQTYITTASATLDTSQNQLTDAYTQLNSGLTQLSATKATLDATQASLEQSDAQLVSAQTQLNDSQTQLDEQRKQGLQKLADSWNTIEESQATIDDGWTQLNDLQAPTWYLLDREDSPGYSGYNDDANRINKISQVFPVFFLLVAALVCLTTMTRMVEEQRTEIGTLKALGYSKSRIVMKYIIYATSASILGTFFGLAIGFQVIPTVVFNAYRTMYILPDVIAPFRWSYALLCFGAAILCTGVAAYWACLHELHSQPAELMRPKPPKSGKRVFLERIRFFWKRLSFLQKVSVRNIFRYKSRIIMTVIGIAGCTALLLAGFGIQYSVLGIVDKQYESVFRYDLVGIYDDAIDTQQKNSLYTELSDNPYLSEYLIARESSATVSNDAKSMTAYAMIPQYPDELGSYIDLHNRRSGEPLRLTDDGAVITEKLAKLFDVRIGDMITVDFGDDVTAQVTVSGIAENYTLNYVYLSPQAYRAATGKDVVFNAFIANLGDDTEANEDALSEQLLQNSDILALSYASDAGKGFNDLIQSLNYVVLVIIVSAGTLAFVVLYNLANINVTERIREIATIKVLGFYDKEVSRYIDRENTVSSMIGMIFGLFLGIPLKTFIINTAEVDDVMFLPGIDVMSFIYAIALTVLFTLIVNFALHFRLKKVDMVESLKSIE
ncbi:MAG: FtsX-like permease family protein [Anaerofustis sp.]